MNHSTSILDLPTDPIVSGNISLTANEQTQVPTSNVHQSGVSLDQTTINQIINGLQQASISGSTQLSSRDIPMTTSAHSTDAQIQPNYIPPPPVNHPNLNYIQENEEITYVDDYNKKNKTNKLTYEFYNELQMPLLVAILYFLFQLPFFRNFLFTYLNILFSKDGNLNINGFLFTSTLFGLLFYVLNKVIIYFDAF